MSNYIINVTSGGVTGSIIADVGFRYTDKLNDVNEAEIKISGTGSVRRGLLVVGAIVEIKRAGTREFYGILDNIDYLDGGAISCHVSGYEIWLAREPRVFTNSPWTATASATIFSAIIGESSYFTAGTVEAGSSVDFRAEVSESLWNALGRLAKKTQQDVQVDYPNLEIDILDHRGTATATTTFNDGIQIRNLRVSFTHPLGNSIKVWGKGDGADQITATATDATSITTYGEIVRNITDVTLISTADAQKRADAERDLSKDPTKIYDFEVVNPNQTLIAGDHILLNSKDKDLTNEEVRIVGIDRGMRADTEYLTLQVTNAAWGSLSKTRNEIMAGLLKDTREATTYMQGSGNLSQWEGMINGNNSVGLKIPFYVGSNFEDEAGNLRVGALTADYDVDKYRKDVGSAAEDNVAPSLTGGNTASHKHDATDGGHAHGLPTMTSSEVSITGSIGNLTSQSVTPAAGGWTYIGSIDPTGGGGTYGLIYVHIVVTTDTGHSGADDLIGFQIRFHATGSSGKKVYVHGIKIDVSLDISTTVYMNTFVLPILASTTDNLYFYMTSESNDDYVFNAYSYVDEPHSHSITGYDADSGNAAVSDSNKTPALTGDAASHAHNVSIGDGVSDGASVNASQVSIYLDFWNTGTTNWDNKHSVLNTGKTLDTDVDLTDSSTYPDAKGFWRVRVITDNASPDLIQAIVNIKHQMDN